MLTCDVFFASKNKKGEEVCGDSIRVKKESEKVVVSISDGLGSGIKASILSTLTSTIATTMLANGLTVTDVFRTILATLPVCRVRRISYSNLCSVVCDFKNEICTVVEYEFPVVMLFRENRRIHPEKKSLDIEGRRVSIWEFHPEKGMMLFLATDGLSQAGMGTELFPLGFGVENIESEIKHLLRNHVSPADIVRHFVRLAEKLDRDVKGDDTLVACLNFREKRILNLFVGPPERKEKDEEYVKKFLSLPGKKIVCGGTTGQIFERVTGKKVEIDLYTFSENSPPVGYMEGIDLLTEGIVTLTQVFRYLEGQSEEMGYGAKFIVENLLEADEINFFVGRAINPAHQNPLFSHDISLKFRLVKDIAHILQEMGKIVNVQYC
ncbi:SpoIIE family protein phosphatase [Thermotoga sp. SG1]|uniref:SpoIIE family protein phosphatase n=1 Tax=Thermotoga sp. SG1 TaxID=126739 RepID=UPI000C78A167|nr:SpoIIE family protein phosphatase [Thermotoga sp. SG1]PLV55710.1 stage II sporulation protein [Thermotoga sp. SG1]